MCDTTLRWCQMSILYTNFEFLKKSVISSFSSIKSLNLMTYLHVHICHAFTQVKKDVWRVTRCRVCKHWSWESKWSALLLFVMDLSRVNFWRVLPFDLESLEDADNTTLDQRHCKRHLYKGNQRTNKSFLWRHATRQNHSNLQPWDWYLLWQTIWTTNWSCVPHQSHFARSQTYAANRRIGCHHAFGVYMLPCLSSVSPLLLLWQSMSQSWFNTVCPRPLILLWVYARHLSNPGIRLGKRYYGQVAPDPWQNYDTFHSSSQLLGLVQLANVVRLQTYLRDNNVPSC